MQRKRRYYMMTSATYYLVKTPVVHKCSLRVMKRKWIQHRLSIYSSSSKQSNEGLIIYVLTTPNAKQSRHKKVSRSFIEPETHVTRRIPVLINESTKLQISLWGVESIYRCLLLV